jgi:HEAT repeat protein
MTFGKFGLPFLLALTLLIPVSRAAGDAVAEDEAMLKQMHVGTDGRSLLEFFRKRSLTEADRKRLQGLVRQLGADLFKDRKKAAVELINLGPPALPFLKAALNDPEPEIARQAAKAIKEIKAGPGPELPAAAARLLAVRHPRGAVAALLTYLPFIDNEWLEEEVLVSLGSLAIRGDKVDPRLSANLKDRDPARRAGAAYTLGLMGDAAQRGRVRTRLADPFPLVRRRAAEGLIGKEVYREAAESAAADEALLKENRIGTGAAALAAYLRKRSLSDRDRQHFRELARGLGSTSFRTRKEAARDLIAAGSQALPFLRQAMNSPDLELVNRAERCIHKIESGPGTALPMAAVRLLVQRAPADAVKVLLTYAPSAEDENVEETVLAGLLALSVRAEKLPPELPAALKDKDPGRRAAAAYVLGRVGTQAECKAVANLLKDADAKVRFRAAQGLLYAKDRSGVPVLLALLESKADAALPAAAEEMLRRAAGPQGPVASVVEGTAAQRKKAQGAWAAWWRARRQTLDLARMQRQTAQRGLTVVSEFNNNQFRAGVVWEFGRDFKPRWKIKKLQGPIDAQVIGGGRVLIAEFYGRQVSERDLKGNVLWAQRVDNPIACARLPGGNTFIATMSNLMEVNRKHQIIRNFNRSGDGTLYSAQVLRNGHVVYITSAGWVVELDGRTGKVIHRFSVGLTGAWSGVEKLPNGRFLLSLMGTGQVKEVDARGRQLWKARVTGAHQSLRLPNGRTLVVCMNTRRLVEIDRSGRVVWKQDLNGRPWRVRRR